jgi:hypothetical protein
MKKYENLKRNRKLYKVPPYLNVDNPREKVLITGSGRSGTTFLVVLLSRLGYWTGVKKEQLYKERLWEEKRAGIEPNITQEEWDIWHLNEKLADEIAIRIAPIVKAPNMGPDIARLMAYGVLDFKHIIIPVRYMKEAAKSRVDVNLHWNTDWREPSKNKEEEYLFQEKVLHWAVGKTIEGVGLFDIPLTIMNFPAIVQDPNYCFYKLKIPFPNIEKKEFMEVWKKTANPKMIQVKLR